MPVIKKYENRRLYDTEASHYVNLDDISRMVAENIEVSVVDVKTGRDLTREILLQIVLESGTSADLFPVPLLRRVIRAGGSDPLPRMLREQLVIGLDLVEAQLDQSETYLERLLEPLRGGQNGSQSGPPSGPQFVAEPPAAPYGAWEGAGTLQAANPVTTTADLGLGRPNSRTPSPFDAHGGEELDELRAQLARLEERLKR
ncbi:MAG: polyhydroxyalkanoate synthesis regulator DNA-binding domain-containing protein [Pseudomonadota bacterium]|nr:polyhydroxyalkanoate synthesis regulator DNA-binding domain-containing protein [Pseudomonadota bacterium]